MLLIRFLLTPIAFALGFLTPLIAQSMAALGWAIDGVPNLVVGLVIALTLGITAQIRGGWLWHSSKA
ncbi:MAG: hypothetical protein NXH85_18085 [Pseudomonadaceae bacterium]|nr:hypothetical protein [Pseudomonadaceae bacterium]